MTATVHTPTSNEGPVRRAWASRTPKWQRFQAVMIKPTETATSVESKQKELFAYQRQYSHIYHHRLMALRDRCWQAIRKDSNDGNAAASNNDDDTTMYSEVNRILELKEDQPSRIVGTLVKECADPKEDPLLPKHICRPSDQLYLEDESGRVILTFEPMSNKDKDDNGAATVQQPPSWDVYQFCTGVVVGIEGTVDDKGILHVDRIVSPAPLPPPTNSVSDASVTAASEPAGQDPHVLLVSSLECGDPQVSSLPREMLVSYLQGQFTDSAAKVARMIVAGSGPSATDPLAGLKEFDMFVGLEIAGKASSLEIPVDILPSSKDPTTANWPQRPLHSSLLPLSTKDKKMVMTTPNPYEAVHGTKLVLGTDGLNVRDLQQSILKKSDDDSQGSPKSLTELEALEQTLRWAHLCPTGPDRLGMVPTDDSMVMDKSTPHIYFCGNCEEGFATKLVKDGNSDDGNDKATRLVCIPKFSQTGEAVLVNLKTLDVEVLRFKVDENDDDAEE